LGHARDVQRGARGEGQGERPAAPGRCDRSQYGRPARRRGATTASRSKDVRGATSHPRSVNTKRALSMGVPMSSSHMSWHGARRRCGLVSSALATCRSPSQLHHSTHEAAATPHPRRNRACRAGNNVGPAPPPTNSSECQVSKRWHSPQSRRPNERTGTNVGGLRRKSALKTDSLQPPMRPSGQVSHLSSLSRLTARERPARNAHQPIRSTLLMEKPEGRKRPVLTGGGGMRDRRRRRRALQLVGWSWPKRGPDKQSGSSEIGCPRTNAHFCPLLVRIASTGRIDIRQPQRSAVVW